MIIWRMRIACWIPKATHTHTHTHTHLEYVILIALPVVTQMLLSVTFICALPVFLRYGAIKIVSSGIY
jgi:hypothetical protein